ncbi:arsenate reductase ArsC [Luteibacter sp. NPDC031894]|uniref:arsenate reductase ArsC n=1 Tax=Luteibacter sp. NPDC031894 TaxID=3390572 RepID=UPI003CFBC60F
MTYRVLFVCTGNSARSVLAEATLRAWGGGRFEAFSAGSQPTGRINPFALKILSDAEMPIAGLRSKSWDEFTGEGAPPIDLVVTVCDSAASEPCPVFFGDFVRTHWGLPDPAAVEGDDTAKHAAFLRAHATIKARLTAFLTLPPESWADREVLKGALDRIAFIPSEEATHV